MLYVSFKFFNLSSRFFLPSFTATLSCLPNFPFLFFANSSITFLFLTSALFHNSSIPVITAPSIFFFSSGEAVLHILSISPIISSPVFIFSITLAMANNVVNFISVFSSRVETTSSVSSIKGVTLSPTNSSISSLFDSYNDSSI